MRVDDRVLITVSEAARRLGTYPNAINRWIAKGELEAFRVQGRGFRFVDAEHVEALRLALVGLEGRRQSHPKPAETTEFRKKSLEDWRMTYGEGRDRAVLTERCVAHQAAHLPLRHTRLRVAIR